MESLSRPPRLTVFVERLSHDELVWRVVRKRARGGLSMDQRSFEIPGTGWPARRPQQNQRHHAIAPGEVEFRSSSDDVVEQLHHHLETVDCGRRPFARLLAHGQRQSVGALRHCGVESDAVLADLNTLDGEFLAALTVLFVFHKPGGGPRRPEKGLDRRLFHPNDFKIEGPGLCHRGGIRPTGESALGLDEHGAWVGGLDVGEACASTDFGDRRRLLEGRSASEGQDH